MPLISKEIEVQEKLGIIYEHLIAKRDFIMQELQHGKSVRIKNKNNLLYDEISSKPLYAHCTYKENKFLEYNIYCHMVEVLDDFKDVYGNFPEYYQMYQTLTDIMLRFAEEEKYEMAALIKLWVDKIKKLC